MRRWVVRRHDDDDLLATTGGTSDDERRLYTENASAVRPSRRRAVNSERAAVDINENLGIFVFGKVCYIFRLCPTFDLCYYYDSTPVG
jgi:hypothetical protein